MGEFRISDAGRELLNSSFRADTPEEAYSKWAATYDSDSFDALGFSSPRFCAQVAAKYLQELSNAKNDTSNKAQKLHLLDMGCGTGALGTLLKEHHGLQQTLELDGSDLTQAMLDVADKRPDIYHSLKKVDIAHTPWPYPISHYDMVLCNGVLVYVEENLQAVLQEFCRVLCVGGKAVLMIREDDVAKWEPAMTNLKQTGAWELTYQTEARNNFENVTNEDGKVWYRIKVFTKLLDLDE
jgi:ubiquinone/menaquinone biosynthesis C-methylase UbiE